MFEGFRVYLRALEPEDWKVSVAWRKDDAIWSSLVGRKYFVSSENERKWVEHAISDKNDIKLAVCLCESDLYIGNIYLTSINWMDRNASIAYLLGEKEYWGRGIGTEMNILMLWHAFWDLGLERVYARVLVENPASVRLLEKCGYQQEGLLRRAVFKNGQFRDLIIMSILRDEFFEFVRERYGVDM